MNLFNSYNTGARNSLLNYLIEPICKCEPCNYLDLNATQPSKHSFIELFFILGSIKQNASLFLLYCVGLMPRVVYSFS